MSSAFIKTEEASILNNLGNRVPAPVYMQFVPGQVIASVTSTMDEFYNKSDIVILGGSFTNNGGHNPIEAAVASCAIITGPNVYNWQNLYDDMMEKKSCIMIKNPKELENNIVSLIEDKNLIMKYKRNALSFSQSIFFEEDKLLGVINSKLECNA